MFSNSKIWNRFRHSPFGVRLRTLKAQLGLINHEILWDIVDACPMRCPTCPTGIQPSRDGHRMSIKTFVEILDKLEHKDKLKIYKIQLYRWSDPLLHPDLHLFIRECNRRGIRSATSSVLQAMNCDLEKVLAAEPTEFRVSFSGWKSMHIHQKGARPQRFIDNLVKISKIPTSPNTERIFFFHRYKDNLDEEADARILAYTYGFKFVAFEATYMLYDRIVENYTGDKPYTEAEKVEIGRLTETPEQNIARLRKKPCVTDYCRMQSEEITLDSHGRVQQCQMMYPAKYIQGNILDEPMKDIRARILTNDFCKKCKMSGVIPYSKIFGDPAMTDDPKAIADTFKYKELV